MENNDMQLGNVHASRVVQVLTDKNELHGGGSTFFQFTGLVDVSIGADFKGPAIWKRQAPRVYISKVVKNNMNGPAKKRRGARDSNDLGLSSRLTESLLVNNKENKVLADGDVHGMRSNNISIT